MLKRGYVKWFNSSRGFGMITEITDEGDNQEDIFFHYSSIMVKGFKSLPEKTKVEFELVRSEDSTSNNNGMKAINVRPTNLVES